MFPSGIKGKNMLIFHFNKVEIRTNINPLIFSQFSRLILYKKSKPTSTQDGISFL